MAYLQSMHHTEYDEEDRGRKGRWTNCEDGGSREKKDDEEGRGGAVLFPREELCSLKLVSLGSAFHLDIKPLPLKTPKAELRREV